MKKVILIMSLLLVVLTTSCTVSEEPLTLKERAGTYKGKAIGFGSINGEMTIIIDDYGRFTFKYGDGEPETSDFFPTESTELTFTVKIGSAKHSIKFDSETGKSMIFTSSSIMFGVIDQKYSLTFLNSDTY